MVFSNFQCLVDPSSRCIIFWYLEAGLHQIGADTPPPLYGGSGTWLVSAYQVRPVACGHSHQCTPDAVAHLPFADLDLLVSMEMP